MGLFLAKLLFRLISPIIVLLQLIWEILLKSALFNLNIELFLTCRINLFLKIRLL